jgi:hypothetical protein
VKVCPTMDSASPVWTKPREPKRKVAQGSAEPCGPPSDPLVKFVEAHDVPLPSAPTVGVLYRWTVNLC